jgi:putative DNA primase/helicase
MTDKEDKNGKKPEPLDPEEFKRIAADLEALDILFAPPSQPMPVARKLMKAQDFRGLPTLKHWRGEWMRWEETHWIEIEDRTVRAEIYERLEEARYMTPLGPLPWEPNRYKINDVLDALRGIIHLPGSYNPPCWLPGTTGTDSPVIAAKNGLLDVLTRELRPLMPGFFNLVAVPFDYDPNAPTPTRWLEFLHQLWPDDEEAIKALQDWFGYVLSGRTDLQKIFVIIGPIRSGKGTIARVLTAMIGKGHVSNPTLSSLGTEFGLAPLLGKSLAIIGDARLGPKTDTRAVIERLLSISGEDSITVNRKFKDQVSARLPTRFMIISNELPAFGDASGAIASRFVLTTLTESFLGKEDTELEQRLIAELPGILNWALVGLDRISRQRFTVPKSSAEAVAELQDLVSPMSAFVRDRCNQGPEHTVVIDVLYGRYRDWCVDNGHHPVSKPMFGRDLRAVLPRLQTIKQHGEQRQYLGIGLKPNPWDRSTGGRNAQHSGSSGSDGSDGSQNESPSGSTTGSQPGEPLEPHESSLQPLIDESLDIALSKTNGRCPECKWHLATQGHRADCPHFKTEGAQA